MQIPSFALSGCRNYTTYAKPTAKSSMQSKEDFSSHFSSPDDITVGRDSYGTIFYQMASPYVRLMEQYQRYLAQRTGDYELPDSYGKTEENLVWLRERYSGELTWMEREEVLDTLVKMGIINNQQKFSAHGGSLSPLTAGSFAIAGGMEPIEIKAVDLPNDVNDYDPLERDWNVLFKGKPIAGFLTIDDILDWVKDLPDDSWDPLRMRIVGAD